MFVTAGLTIRSSTWQSLSEERTFQGALNHFAEQSSTNREGLVIFVSLKGDKYSSRATNLPGGTVMGGGASVRKVRKEYLMDQSSDKDLPIWAQILLGEEPAPERKQESREIPDDEASSEGGKAA